MFNFYIDSSAVKIISSTLEKLEKPNGALRVGIKGSGCKGFMYHFDYIYDDLEKYISFKESDVQVLIDHKSMEFLQGATLSWKNGLFEKGFVITNPNVESSCGCRKSFSIKND